MDITDTSEARFNLGVERFLANESLTYRGVVFYKEADRALQINSYSGWEPNRTTEAHAKETISDAKSVLADLAERSSQFREVAARLPHEHFFCHDYGQGAIALAKELGGKFQWLAGSSNKSQ